MDSASNATERQSDSAGGNAGAKPAPHSANVALNRATEQELQNVPHLGPERACELIALRPITDLSQLTAINGIGATRLDDIRDYGVTLDLPKAGRTASRALRLSRFSRPRSATTTTRWMG